MRVNVPDIFIDLDMEKDQQAVEFSFSGRVMLPLAIREAWLKRLSMYTHRGNESIQPVAKKQRQKRAKRTPQLSDATTPELPHEFLNRMIAAHPPGLTITAIAVQAGMATRTLRHLREGSRSLTEVHAKALASLLGFDADHLMALQADHFAKHPEAVRGVRRRKARART